MADQHRIEGGRPRRRVACVLLLQGGEDLTALAEACFRFSPQVSIREGAAVFIEVGGSRALFSEASIEARLKALAQRLLRSPVRVACGDTAATALVAARFPAYARSRNLGDLPLEALSDYAQPFEPDADLDKRVLRVRCILESLGIGSVGAFAVLPRASLASRLGKDAVSLMAHVWGDLEHAWPGFHPEPRVLERDELRDPEAHGLCADLEGSLFVLKGLVDRAMARLRGRGERASRLEIRFHPGGRQWRVDLPLPQGSTFSLMPILREKLAHGLGREPLSGPVEAMELEITESVPGSGTQRDFFSRKEEDREAWDGLVARLAARLGKDRVFVAFPQERYLPERAYARRIISVPVATEAGTGGVVRRVEESAWPGRPSRVLKRPEPIAKEGRLLKASDGKQWKAVSWEGPERISGEWWKDPAFDGFNRDYYRVITESGDQLWVFANRKGETQQSMQPELYLHGFFD